MLFCRTARGRFSPVRGRFTRRVGMSVSIRMLRNCELDYNEEDETAGGFVPLFFGCLARRPTYPRVKLYDLGHL